MERKNISDQIFSLIRNEGNNLKYPDQDALNIIFRGRLVYLDRIYNSIYPLKSEFEKKIKVIIKNTLQKKPSLFIIQVSRNHGMNGEHMTPQVISGLFMS